MSTYINNLEIVFLAQKRASSDVEQRGPYHTVAVFNDSNPAQTWLDQQTAGTAMITPMPIITEQMMSNVMDYQEELEIKESQLNDIVIEVQALNKIVKLISEL